MTFFFIRPTRPEDMDAVVTLSDEAFGLAFKSNEESRVIRQTLHHLAEGEAVLGPEVEPEALIELGHDARERRQLFRCGGVSAFRTYWLQRAIAPLQGDGTATGFLNPVRLHVDVLLHLTRQMAVELARFGIRVNAIAPGYVATDINRDYFASEPGQAMIKRIPQRRLGSPDDLTGPLLLLASAAGAHMTGATVTVDGGHSVNPL